MQWQCTYVDSKGKRCEEEALYRLHFSIEHPFDHIDVCRMHLEEYRYYTGFQDLHEFRGEEN